MDALAFWAASLAAGAIGWPVAARLLRRFPDAGAGLAIPTGLLLVTFLLFTLRTASVLPAGRGGFLLAAAGAGLIAAIMASRDPRFLATTRRVGPSLLLIGGLFTVLFFSYATFRSYSSEILRHSEQTMDLMYLNAALHSPEYPPQDGWLAGERASYYYFGYIQVATLTAIADVPASTGYTLGLATTFASAGVAAVSVGAALTRWLLPRPRRRLALAGGLAGGGLLLLAGSLSAPFEWAAAHERYNSTIFEAAGLEALLPCDQAPASAADCYRAISPRTSEWYPTEFYFWWRASRIIPDTITEFPAFSFLLGDLHPHVMGIPLVLTAIALSAAAWRGRGVLCFDSHRRAPFQSAFVGVALGALAFANAWDAPTFMALFAAAVFARNARTDPLPRAAKLSLGYLGPIIGVAIVAYSPWYADFSSQADGLQAYAKSGTIPGHAVLQWGLLLGIDATGFLVAARRLGRHRLTSAATYAAWLPLAPLLLWIGMLTATGDLGSAVDARGAEGWVTLIAYGALLTVLGSATLATTAVKAAWAPVLGLATLGVLLLYGAELFYIGDVFEGSVPRLNTVFKLSYQAWIVLAVGGGAALVTALASRGLTRTLGALSAAVAVVALTYAVIAIPNRSGGFDGPSAVDGLDFVRRSDPAEYAVTRWLEANAPRGSVVVEASGRRWGPGADGPALLDANVDYTDTGRIAARAGTVAPVGQYFHEIQWRGDSEANHQLLTKRQDAVDAIYLATEPAVALAALREFDAVYVVVGRFEQQQYGAAGLADFASFLDIAFESGELRVYALPTFRLVRTS